ncbi:hypothetical protein CEXT_367191 [Caerostris extrusa]|uniref:Uncharacterized protein n=1 Tax=Caerostris extrusa TaxID=172846 RepID=A0AAV4T5K8_CAEEX|nr:hypothetical protein CEXT_367191 [Caerostris extrusa]
MGRQWRISIIPCSVRREPLEATRMVSGWLLCDSACSINHLTLMRVIRRQSAIARENVITSLQLEVHLKIENAQFDLLVHCSPQLSGEVESSRLQQQCADNCLVQPNRMAPLGLQRMLMFR